MKLYTYDPAPNPQRLTLFLNYKGLALDSEQIDLAEGAQLQPDFAAINPEKTVPCLVTDTGERLAEVVGICLYLEALYPQKPLFGSSDIERAQVVNWMHTIFTQAFVPVGDMLRNRSQAFASRALPGAVNLEQIPALIERGDQRLSAWFEKLDAHLAAREFVAINQFSQADIDAYVQLGFCAWVKREVPEGYRHISRWREQVSALLASA